MMEYWTSLASLLGALAFFQGALHAVFPAELRAAVVGLFGRVACAFSPYCYFDVTETDGMSTNEIYDAVQLYLSSSAAPSAGARLSLSRPHNASSFTFGLASNDRVVDAFNGAAVMWEHVVAPRETSAFSWRPLPEERRRFTLRIRRGDRDKLMPAYLDHILAAAADIRRRNQDRLLYTNAHGPMDTSGLPWDRVPFKHPSTFDTLAMDPARKAAIMDDLRDFADGSAFYVRTGRAWKRGYLLYGPPGTGKSSMIAAMANYLGYDVYDLELTEVRNNAELRKLLMKTTSKSIIVIEDIDCSVDLTNRSAAPRARRPPQPAVGSPVNQDADTARSITLSGLLNFTDGLWSCCGSERIFVFTTNHVEKLDAALLRSGRMDMHIFMSYCSFPALKILLKNYLDFGDGELDRFGESEDGGAILNALEESIDAAEITPADVSEVLIKNRRSGKLDAMRNLLEVVRARADKRKETGGATARTETAEREEEQEKRALESPKEGKEQSDMDRCNGNEEEEAKKQQ